MERDPWFKNAIIYGVDIETFNDSDDDGVGDVQGLIERLDYLDRLGVTVIWLLPFYPSPNLDNGYDVADYYGVDSRLGTLGDFVEFLREADSRGIDVVIDLVVNHTSDQHPWFRAAREDPDSKYRDYYVWSTDPPEDGTQGNVFPGEVEDSRVWTYDERAESYYYHRFYPFQPELNTANPAVQEEIRKIAGFWLELGVDGFRIDAAGLMVQRKDPAAPAQADPHELFHELKEFVVRRQGGALLLAEADDDPEKLDDYFAGGAGFDLLLNFVLNAHLVLALAEESADAVVDGLDRLPVPPEGGSWANFLRNYDELNLGRLPAEDQRTVFERFASDERMRIYGRGVRRRLAPMLDDRRHRELALSLLFSMPGAPLVLYGEEIGMGDDLDLPGRTSVRTPMQWSDERNAGFSTAAADDLVLPVVSGGPFGYERVNVADQRADPASFLNWFEHLVDTRKECSEIGHGEYEIVTTEPPSVLVHRYEAIDRGEGGSLLCVHNLADESREVTVAPERIGVRSGRPYRLLGDADCEARADGSWRVSLDGYGYGWFRVAEGGET